MRFLGEFERMLYFQGFEVISGGIVVIFGVVKSGGNGVKWAFYRTQYRSGYLNGFWMKYFGNADFIRSLWMEEICPFRQSNICSKM